MGSPRPSWLVWASMTSGYPPSSAMPTLNDTRVRVDGLSKMTATARGPVSGWRISRSAFIASARSSTSRSSAGLRSSSRRKCLGMNVSQRGGEAGQGIVDVGLGKNERRGQPDDVGFDGVHQHAALTGGLLEGGGVVAVQHESPPQPG